MNIRESVFDNETEAMLYVFKDTEGEGSFIFSLPIYTFSWEVESERDLEHLLNFNFLTKERREKLIEVMKEMIEESST